MASKRDRERARQWMLDHPEQYRLTQKEWREAHPNYAGNYRRAHLDKAREYNMRYYLKHRQICTAHNLARKIPRKNKCDECGSTENLEAHHPNYDKPMKIMTLCLKCHLRRHLLENQIS